MIPIIEVPKINKISKADFYTNYVKTNKPVVIKNLIESWPALSKWDFNYFKAQFPETIATTINLANGACDVSLDRGVTLTKLPFKTAVEKLETTEVSNKIAVATSEDNFPAPLKQDYTVPEYCSDGSFLRARVFMSSDQTITKIHQDLFENLYCMVKGSKVITLFEPKEKVYPYSRFSKLPNHAAIDPENIDFDAFPKMKNAKKYVVHLQEGETLFLPSFWWHHLKGVNNNIAVSYWWADGWKIPIVWGAIQYKNLRGI